MKSSSGFIEPSDKNFEDKVRDKKKAMEDFFHRRRVLESFKESYALLSVSLESFAQILESFREFLESF